LAFMLLGILYPTFNQAMPDPTGPSSAVVIDQVQSIEIQAIKTTQYIVLIGVQVVVAFGFLIGFRKTYLAQFPLALNNIAIPVGICGAFLWIGICGLGIEQALSRSSGLFELAGVRPSLNPFQQIPDETLQLVFLLLRFCLLALLVPIIEELFLRGWLIRYIEDPTWWAVSLVSLSLRSVAWATIYGVLAHPGEALAAFVWFSLVSWLMLRAGNLWDCVVAHGITNLLLGIYIVAFGAWHL